MAGMAESFELVIFFWRDRPHPVADKIRLTVDSESVLVQAFKEGSITKEGYFPLTNGQLITRYHGKELGGGSMMTSSPSPAMSGGS